MRHRRLGATAWAATITAAAAAGAVLIDGYAKGDQIEIQAAAVSSQGTFSLFTTTTGHVVAATDPAAPNAPAGLSVSTPGAGAIHVSVTSSPSASAVATQIMIASGANATFASAQALGEPISSGPNTPLFYDAGGLSTGTYRIWAVALDAQKPPAASVPAGPFNIQVA